MRLHDAVSLLKDENKDNFKDNNLIYLEAAETAPQILNRMHDITRRAPQAQECKEMLLWLQKFITTACANWLVQNGAMKNCLDDAIQYISFLDGERKYYSERHDEQTKIIIQLKKQLADVGKP